MGENVNVEWLCCRVSRQLCGVQLDLERYLSSPNTRLQRPGRCDLSPCLIQSPQDYCGESFRWNQDTCPLSSVLHLWLCLGEEEEILRLSGFLKMTHISTKCYMWEFITNTNFYIQNRCLQIRNEKLHRLFFDAEVVSCFLLMCKTPDSLAAIAIVNN